MFSLFTNRLRFSHLHCCSNDDVETANSRFDEACIVIRRMSVCICVIRA